jgi:RNA polymerase sigma factor (sigma-70 family)
VDTHKGIVFNTSLGIVQDHDDAEDVAQEVFIQAFHSIGRFKGESKLSTWLYRIAVTKALDHLRAKKSRKRFGPVQRLFETGHEPANTPATFIHPGVVLENKERASLLFKAIDQLPEKQKAAFVLHKTEGLSYQEVAEVLGLTVSAVESLLVRAKGNLYKYLEKYYKSEP